MPKFSKTISVDAEQILFTEAEKAAVKKGIPTTVHGGDLKLEDGKFIVPLLINGKTVQAEEGQWIVNDTLLSDEDFKKEYKTDSWETDHTHPAHVDGIPATPATGTTAVGANGLLSEQPHENLPKE